jgi:nicotinamide-nucleotide amidase
MPDRNRVQAYLPAGAEAVPNTIGTAPGIWMRLSRAWVAALPGVPGEMKPMFDEFVVPRLRDLGLTAGVTAIRTIHTFGMGESQVESQLLDLTLRGREPEVGITASDAVITLRIVARAPTVAEAEAQIADTESLIRQRLGSLVYGVDGEQLEDVVIRELIARRQTIVTAESVTAGLVSRLLGRVPGASAALLGGVVAYANEVKQGVLGVPESLIRAHGAVSAPGVEAMAAGARLLMGSDYALATSGIAGPTGATATKPIGLVYIGLAWPNGVTSTHVNWFGSREEIQTRSAKSALNMLRLHLEKSKVEPQTNTEKDG